MIWLRLGSSRLMGWLADRRVPGPLRPVVYGSYCRMSGADPREAELESSAYPSLGAFFVRRLKPGLRKLDPDPGVWGSPCDGTVQALDRVSRGSLIQAKGHAYRLAELLGADERGFEGSWAWTLYLSPRDYHRVHVPVASRLVGVRWIRGERRSVAPRLLERRAGILSTNERAVLTLEAEAGEYVLVMVGALNVGRIRVVGVDPGGSPPASLPSFDRGSELARFEMGSTVVLIAPSGKVVPLGPAQGDRVRLHEPIARTLT
jgi:phosphatidylserine decarboxylase